MATRPTIAAPAPPQASGAPGTEPPALPDVPATAVLMLGKGWFPDEIGGLDRYFRELLEHLPEATGVVVGPAASTPSRVLEVSGHEQALHRRLLAFWRASQQAADAAQVIDTHFALYALAPLWVGRLRRLPVVLHFHGPWALESRAAGDSSGPRVRLKGLVERAAYRRADAAVVLTSAFRQVLVERYGLLPWAIHVEPPGVDLARFTVGSREVARRGLGIAPEDFVAVCVRRLSPRMGIDVLLESWAEIVEDLPEGSRLLIAGDGPQRGELQAQIDRSGIAASVALLGRVPEAQLVDLYRAADVGVVPSLEHEGFGLVAIEAAACGTPSIVTDVGGLPEAIARLDPTLVVPAGDAPALGARLLRAGRQVPSRAAARDHAERFDWQQVADNHRRLYRRVTQDAPRDRLRVVYLGHVARMSGAEIALLRLLPHLEHTDAHVLLGEDGPLVRRLHLAGVSTEVLPLASRTREVRKGHVERAALTPAVLGASTAYVARLARRLRRLQPDLVHANSLKSGVYGAAAARLAGVPMVWHVRDRIDEDYLPARAAELVRVLVRALPAAVVTNSQATLGTLALDARSRRRDAVLPDVIERRPPRAPRPAGPLTFGIVGRLAPWKGQDLFLRAFAGSFSDGAERAVIVGGALFGEDDYERDVKALAASLGLGDRVEFRGHRDDVWDELERIDVLVHASLTAEPFGQVVLEAMAAGVPVIAAAAGGPAEILDHDRTGLLYRPGDPAGLGQAMWRMREKRLREQLSAAALGELHRYEPRAVAAQLEDLYAQIGGVRRR